MLKYLLTIILTLILTTSAYAWTLTSEPSTNENVTHWKIELNSGEVYNGTVVNGTVNWDITNLPQGVYNGTVHFGLAEWTLQSEGSTKEIGFIWSNGTEFKLKRNIAPENPSKINIKD